MKTLPLPHAAGAIKKAMKTTQALPENYTEILTIDLQKNKKLMLFVNALALLIAAVMAIIMHLFVPFRNLFDMSDGLGIYALRFGALLLGIIIYTVLHEAVHGIAMRLMGGTHTRFGFTGIYAFAGSEKDYFGKWQYLFVALAPLVCFGALLGILQAVLPLSPAWLWVLYFIQIMNVSGAAGDIFVSLRMLPLPASILVRDTGVSMTAYDRK